jgi:hypothetical protein
VEHPSNFWGQSRLCDDPQNRDEPRHRGSELAHEYCVDRPHAPRGNATVDAPRRNAMTQGIMNGVTTRSVEPVKTCLALSSLYSPEPTRIPALQLSLDRSITTTNAMTNPPITARAKP